MRRCGWRSTGMLGLFFLGVGVVISPLAAQETTATAETDVFVESVEVDVVNVEVVVTDRQGKPVAGLTQEDFELLEDGERVEISNFYAGADEEPRAASSRLEAIPLSSEGEAIERLEVPADQQLHLIVFIDNFNIRPLNRNRAFRSLRQFLDRELRPGDRVMLVTYERWVHIRHPFTQDPRLVIAALDEIEAMSAHGLSYDSERREMLRAVEDAEDVGRILGRLRQHARSIQSDVGFAVGALKKFIEPLSGLPGRKAIVHVSDGFEMTPAEDLFYALQEKFNSASVLNEALNYENSRLVEELAATANSNRVTFYTIDAGGLRVHSYGAAESKGGGFDRLTPTIDALHLANTQSPLRLLAEETGGAAIVNTNDPLAGLSRIGAELRVFYSLGFISRRSSDGRYHRIEVKVRGEGRRVRHRQGYRAKSAGTRMSESTRTALYFDHASNPGQIRVDLGSQQRREAGEYLVPLLVRIPLAEVVLLPRGENHHGRLSLFVTVMDGKGQASAVQQAAIPLTIPTVEVEGAREQIFTYESPLLMRRGRHKVAIGLRDDLGGISSFITQYVAVGGSS